MKKLCDVFPGWLTGTGIFAALQSFNVPWKDENIATSLDLEYFGNVSGDKFISPLIVKLMTGDELTTTERNILATSILAICGANWGKLWATLEFEYNPIENYSMTETMTDDETVTAYGKTHTRTDNLTHGKTGTETETPNLTDTRTDNLTHAKTGTETETPDLSEVTTPNLTNNTENSVYGFNSNTAVDTGTTETTATGTNTVRKTGTNETEYDTEETDTGTQTTVKTGTDTKQYNLSETDTGTQQDVDGGTDTNTRNYTLTRAGNIGVTTSQQMIESERELWKWNFFRDVVFPDLDRVLTLAIY